ncbi:MAG: glycosyltransferase family 2 protein [Actinomycetota bacterium]|nr:glycosyltransferase family 2 protein [Actinomycetota bacterium]
MTGLLLSLEALLALATGTLLTLLAAAGIGRRARPPAARSAQQLRFAVLVPAHDEELDIGRTVAGLQRLEYPRDRYEVVVIADNCRDRTAELAREAGATVYERADPVRRGKGYALASAFEWLRRERPEVEAIAVVDADCQVTPNILTAMDARLRSGAAAVQTDNVVANPHESWSSALRYAAFVLVNTVVPLGRATFGFSCGLRGTGMGFRRDLLERHPWQAFSLAEDGEYQMGLLAAGEPITFAHEAAVTSAMPTALRVAREQHLRWEGGRWHTARIWVPRLVRTGLRERDPGRLLTALLVLVPPQSLLLALNSALVVAAAALRSRLALRLAVVNFLGQVCYVIGGLALVRAPLAVYRALVLAPVLMAWKLGLYGRLLAGRGARTWVRTGRGAQAAGRQGGC